MAVFDLLAFNDHMDSTVAHLDKPQKRSRMVERTGLSSKEFDCLVARVVSRAHDVPASIARLAQAARDANVRMLSHDDETPAMREAFRSQGVGIAEFPVNEETAREAAEAGDFIVFGAPNVVRGGSHTGWTKASDMNRQGFMLDPRIRLLLSGPKSWPRSALPPTACCHLRKPGPDIGGAGRAAGLADRGALTKGRRADIILVDDRVPLRPRIVAVHCRRTSGAPDGRKPSDPFIDHPAQGGCGRVTRPFNVQGWQSTRVMRSITRQRPAACSTVSAHICLATTPIAARILPFPHGVTRTRPDWRDLTQDPRKYGFHATLKAPMTLADGKTEAELAAGLRVFRRRRASHSGH